MIGNLKTQIVKKLQNRELELYKMASIRKLTKDMIKKFEISYRKVNFLGIFSKVLLR